MAAEEHVATEAKDSSKAAEEEPKTEAALDADQLREQGTNKYKAKEYEAAIELYTRSLELNPNEHRCYSNRCAAYCTLKNNLDQALADAEKCVELMPSWAKGYLRVCEALKLMKRAGEAKPWLEKGMEVVSAEDRDSLDKNLKEVPKWEFMEILRGTWHGKVNEVLGGYDQEMEFLENDTEVRVDVLGRSIVGRYWVDVSHDPIHLNIQVPNQGCPPGMPPPPLVPYIARIDDVGLHLCCPYLKMSRPEEFTGPGYVLMKAGAMAQDDGSEVANLGYREKVIKCAQELLKAMPDRQLADVSQSDSEDAAGEKIMAQVRFESSMFSVQRQFGEALVKEVLGLVRPNSLPAELEGVEEIRQLGEKMKQCGLVEEECQPKAAAISAPSGPPPASAPPKDSPLFDTNQRGAEAAAPASGDAAESASSSCSVMVGGVFLSAAAIAAVAFMLSRKK